MVECKDAPWTTDQCASLMAYQHHLGWPNYHPFTCANRGDGNHPVIGDDEGILVPMPDGWRCPFCSYKQDWAWDGMFVTYPINDAIRHEHVSQSEQFFDLPRVSGELETHLCRLVVEYHRARSQATHPDVIDVAVAHLRTIAKAYQAARKTWFCAKLG